MLVRVAVAVVIGFGGVVFSACTPDEAVDPGVQKCMDDYRELAREVARPAGDVQSLCERAELLGEG